MIDPLKPLGAFIENTIRPLLSEFHWFFEECDKRGVSINETSIRHIVDYVARAHFRTVCVQLIQAVLITTLLCATWIISRG
jgi:hypothetical protein